jgi:ribonuclease HII
VIGIDEVGRGAWAGPLLVAAVRLHSNVEGLTDSKLLTKTKRNKLCPLIQANSDIGFGWMSAEQIDTVGLAEALKICALRALDTINPEDNEPIVVDGSVNLLPSVENVSFEPKAELIYPEVAAASIVAKVFRDAYMAALHEKMPQYGFLDHVGYGTAAHIAALQQHGISAWHRTSFKPIELLRSATIPS